MNVLDVNNFQSANLYPRTGVSLGIGASANSPFSTRPSAAIIGGGTAAPNGGTTMTGGAIDAGTQNAINAAQQGRPVIWWIILLGAMLFLMWGAKRLGTDDGNFGSIKMSAYNILTISFAAILGISFWKAFVTKFPIPGLTAIILAA
jgi:hypothetical protein